MNTLPLFDQAQRAAVAEPKAKRGRQPHIDAAFEHADRRFREEYEQILMIFVERGMEFTGEDVQKEYRSRTWLPQPREWRATGGIFQKLKRRGVIRQVGFRARNQGNPTPVYKAVAAG